MRRELAGVSPEQMLRQFGERVIVDIERGDPPAEAVKLVAAVFGEALRELALVEGKLDDMVKKSFDKYPPKAK